MKRPSKTKWTTFTDMHSGGGSKQTQEYIYIEAPEDEAKVIFYNRFGHSASRVTCTCCGPDYSVYESDSLEEATEYLRTRNGEGVGVKEHALRSDVLVIRAKDIKPEERLGLVPVQGYVYL